MKKLLLLLSFFILTSVNAMDKEQWDRHVRNQEAYHMATQRAAAEQIARVSMTPEKKANVSQMVERSFTLEDGSKAKIGASVTKPVDTAKVASTLVDRFKNASKYAKDLGKASIPAFVGTAAFHGLMEGIDYVMDPENNTIQKPNPDYETETTVQPWHQYRYYVTRTQQYVASIKALQKMTDDSFYESTWSNCSLNSNNTVSCDVINNVNGSTSRSTAGYRQANPSYNPAILNPNESHVPSSDQDVVNALKNALESNNPALANAIAEAMKSAYTQDNSEGQPKTTNPLVADAQNDMQRAVDGALDTPTTTAGTVERPEGYYKITDGEKTIEGYIKPTDVTATGTTDSTTVTNPDGSTTTTGTTSTGWPGFCDWAGVVCDFIDWVKEEPEDDTPELPEQELEKKEIKKDLIKVSASSCPNDVKFDVDGLPFGIKPSRPVLMQPICDTIEPLKYVFQLITFCFCAFIILRI